MATSYTTLLGFALPATGELSGTWGDTVNNYLTNYLDSAIAGALTVTTDTTLTKTTNASLGSTSSQYAIIIASPASANITITAPAASKAYMINNTSGTYTVTIRGAGPTTGVTLLASEKAIVAWNGSDFVKVASTSATVVNSGVLAVSYGGTGVTTSTGSGSNVLSNSPTLVTPALGTPASGTLTNATGLPISTGVSGLGTGVATFLATPTSANLISAVTDETGTGALVFATSPTLVTPALGTPASGVLTNATGLPISTGVSGLGTGVATFLGTPTSANLAAAVTDETGSGALVFATSPTLVTPALGTPSSGTLTNCTFPTLNQNTTGSSGSCTGNSATATTATTATTANALNTANSYTGTSFTASTASSYIVANRTSSGSGQVGYNWAQGGTNLWWNYVDVSGTTLNWYNSVASANVMTLTTGGALNTVGAITQNGSQVLTAGNYNSYAPTLTGTGASGTWGISISGNAATATSATSATTAAGLSATLAVGSGGTGLTSGTSGGLLYYSATGTLASSSSYTAGTLLIGAGSGSPPGSLTLGTGVNGAITTAVGSAGGVVVNGGALGTPSSGTLTNCTFPTLNQNTTGSAATFTSTSQNSQFNSVGVGTAGSTTAGEIRATNNITAYYSSDARLKENVVPIANALAKVDLIRGVRFDWTDEYIANHGGEDGFFVRKHDVGVIAQEIEAVLPEVVVDREDGYKAVNYEKIVPLLIAAIKELKAEVEVLKGAK